MQQKVTKKVVAGDGGVISDASFVSENSNLQAAAEEAKGPTANPVAA